MDYMKKADTLRLVSIAFKSMKDKDLIWTLDESKNIYYLCKTTGEYKHLKEEYSNTYGIANCMKVFGYHPISENLVPSEVKTLTTFFWYHL